MNVRDHRVTRFFSIPLKTSQQNLVGLTGLGTVERSEIRKAGWFAGIWTAYMAGAVLGATALERIARTSLFPAVACLAASAVADLISPAELEEIVQ